MFPAPSQAEGDPALSLQEKAGGETPLRGVLGEKHHTSHMLCDHEQVSLLWASVSPST